MRRGFVAFVALSLVGLGLTGCGLFRFEQREPWRTQAEDACLAQRLVQPTAYMARSSKIDGPGICGMDYPFKVGAFSTGSVGLGKPVTLACPIVPRIDTWLDEVVKPAAVMYFGVPVIDLTPSVTVVHQNHDYGHVAGGLHTVTRGIEAQRNWERVGPDFLQLTIADATWILDGRGLHPARDLRHLARRALVYPALTPLLRPSVRVARFVYRALRRA